MVVAVHSRAAVRQHTARTKPALPLQLAMPAAVQRVQNRCNVTCDNIWDPSKSWGPELLDLCKDTSLLILNERTAGDDIGKHTCVSSLVMGIVSLTMLLHLLIACLQQCLCK